MSAPAATAEPLRPRPSHRSPADGLLTRIPADGRRFALTVDDGTSSATGGAAVRPKTSRGPCVTDREP